MWKITGLSNLGSRVLKPMVTLTSGTHFRIVKLDIDVPTLKMLTLSEIEAYAIKKIEPQ
ncbi:hypothetical protein SHA53_004468 [Salmonella enterica]|nr:hypothetical protein [Salmonella enterica]